MLNYLDLCRWDVKQLKTSKWEIGQIYSLRMTILAIVVILNFISLAINNLFEAGTLSYRH